MTKKLLIILIVIAAVWGSVGFLWWQTKEKQTIQNEKVENLTKQIDEPKQDIEESKPVSNEKEISATLKDTRIRSAMAQAQTVMVYVYAMDADYDNFNCEHLDMKLICSEIIENGGKINIVYDSTNNSQEACIYSSLNVKTSKTSYWYCVDSRGVTRHTQVNPNDKRYCAPEGNAICPPFSE